MIEVIQLKLRRLIAKYFSGIVFLIYRLKIHFYNFEKKPPILILTPGKTGSQSVYYTLKRKFKNYHVFHVHNLSDTGIKKSIEAHLSSKRGSVPLHLIVSQILNDKLKDYDGAIKIITLVRDPISRSISSIFQNIDMYSEKITNKYLEINEKVLLDNLRKNIFFSADQLEDWVYREIETNLYINVLNEDGFPDKGFKIYSKNKVELLLMRMEDLDHCFKDAIKGFLNLNKSVELCNYNVSEKKYYKTQYTQIKEKLLLTEVDIRKVFSSKYMKTFYSDRSMKFFIKKYVK